MLLNVPPDKNGLINKREIKTLQKFTKLITEPFEKEIKDVSLFTYSPNGKCREIKGDDLTLESEENGIRLRLLNKKQIKMISLREELTFSQRVEEFKVFAKGENGEYSEIYSGTVIGSRKIIKLESPVNTDEILLIITQSRANPVLKDIRVYE